MGFIRHEPNAYYKKKCSFENQNYTYAIGSGYSLKSCSPAEIFSALPDNLKLINILIM